MHLRHNRLLGVIEEEKTLEGTENKEKTSSLVQKTGKACELTRGKSIRVKRKKSKLNK